MYLKWQQSALFFYINAVMKGFHSLYNWGTRETWKMRNSMIENYHRGLL